jgi:hypothetical protein
VLADRVNWWFVERQRVVDMDLSGQASQARFASFVAALAELIASLTCPEVD